MAGKRGNPNMKKGMPSINPKGRPWKGESKSEKVRALLESDGQLKVETIGDTLTMVLLRQALDPSLKPGERQAAIDRLENRAYGEPRQEVKIEGEGIARYVPKEDIEAMKEREKDMTK